MFPSPVLGEKVISMLAVDELNQVEAIIQERRRRVEEERQRDKEEHLKLLELDAAKQEIIQQERERLLRENAELADFLPKYTLQDNRERDILNSARKQQGGRTQLDPLKPLPRTIQPPNRQGSCAWETSSTEYDTFGLPTGK